MKLLQALRAKIYEEQRKIADTFAKQVGFNSTHDSSTVIEREHAKHAWKWLVQNKQLLVDSFPKENIKKLILLPSIDKDTDLSDVLVIFKQILRSQKARLISRKRYDWNVEQRRQSYTLEYRIISLTPDPIPTRQTPALSPPQTNKTTESNTHTSDINTTDTKVSSTTPQLPPTVVMSAKRKLSPTPAPLQQPPEKKTKPSTPQKQQSSSSNTNMSDVKVLDASPIDTQPPNSPAPTELATASPKALSPTPGGGKDIAQVPVQ